MATALLFPGQGSQYVGMGSDLYERFEEARRIIETADEVLGFPLSEIMFGGGREETAVEALRSTENTQPALYIHSLAVHAVMEKHGVRFEMTAGHSLGEYSALAAAGALSLEDGLRIVRRRGELMADAGTDRPGAMAAVIGMEDETVERVCAQASTGGLVAQPANFNSPGQVVISGDVAAVERAMKGAEEAGARKVIPLQVSGAFHSPLMAAAREGLAQALEALAVHRPHADVYLNVTGAPSRDPDEIRRCLLEQLTAPVRWSQTLLRMQDQGADRFVEVGAGRVLSGLVKRTLGRAAETAAIGTADDLDAFTKPEPDA